VGVGVVLGATVFRTDIAQATGLAQTVTVNNTPEQAVPVREQNLDGNQNIKVHEQGTATVEVSNQEISIEDDFHSSTYACDWNSYTVPAGTKLVIEYIGADAQGNALGVRAYVDRSNSSLVNAFFLDHVSEHVRPILGGE
jgi:hypothetical protein